MKVTTVEIKDVGIPQGMQRAMARQAEAERERRAKVINAEGEFQASERLFDAAEVMSGNPAALQLRYLQTLLEIGTNQNSTIVLPVPIDLIKPLMQSVEDGNERRERARERDRLRAAEGRPELPDSRGRAAAPRPRRCPRPAARRGRRPDRVGGIHEALHPRRAPAARRPVLRPRRPEALRLVRRLRTRRHGRLAGVARGQARPPARHGRGRVRDGRGRAARRRAGDARGARRDHRRDDDRHPHGPPAQRPVGDRERLGVPAP